MMAVDSQCPPAEQLQQLLLGRLAAPDVERWAAHLDVCPRCAAAAASLNARDTLTDSLNGQTSSDWLHDPVLTRLLEQVSAIVSQPGESSQASAAAPENYREVLSPSEQPDEMGRLGPYRVLGILGTGGMGVVFEAEEVALGRRVALKIINPRLAADPDIRARFLREARAVAAIEDERIVAIHRVDEFEGVLYIAMQRLHGHSLEQHLWNVEDATGQRTLATDEALQIAYETARGLASAHARGLIHRDIKPGNIFLKRAADPRPADAGVSSGVGARGMPAAGSRVEFSVKLLDFGLARLVHEEAMLTRPGSAAGTPAYAAPEQFTGAVINPRIDLFSLGCVLYRMLTGRMPFLPGRYGTLSPAGDDGPIPPHELNHDVPVELSALALELLQRDPSRRPVSADVVAERLAEILRAFHKRGTARQASASRRTLQIVGALVTSIIAASLLVLSFFQTERGDFVIETVGPDVTSVVERKGGVTVHDRRLGRKFVFSAGKHALPTGDYEVEVTDADSGLDVSPRRFKIQRGVETTVSVSLRPRPTQPVDAAFTRWIDDVAKLPPAEQAQAVGQKLKELNPGFDGQVGSRFEGNRVTEFHFLTDGITDISPIQALPHLEYLVCRGSEPSKGRLTDLLPIKKLPVLVYLDCSANPIRDLYALRGTSLRELVCWATPISDLDAIGSLQLRMLNVNWTFVSDLSPIRGMSLTRLFVKAPYITSLEGVKPFALTELGCQFRPERHTELLRGITSLQTINDQPAVDFWKQQDARRQSLEKWIPKTAALPAEKQLSELASKLSELNPGYKGRLFPTLENGEVVKLMFFADRITDIAPVRALTKLKHLTIRNRARSKKAPLFDLDPIRSLPLEHLEIDDTDVADLSPLAGSHIKGLACWGSWVRDLNPLRKTPLEFLDCRMTPLTDLQPLVGLPLQELRVDGCHITDLSPLKGLPLRKLQGDFDRQRDGEALRALPNLVEINGNPAAEFWKTPLSPTK